MKNWGKLEQVVKESELVDRIVKDGERRDLYLRESRTFFPENERPSLLHLKEQLRLRPCFAVCAIFLFSPLDILQIFICMNLDEKTGRGFYAGARQLESYWRKVFLLHKKGQRRGSAPSNGGTVFECYVHLNA